MPSKSTRHTYLTILLAYSLCYLAAHPAHGKQRGPIHSASEFSAALQSAQPGDTLIIADGRYDSWDITLACQGAAQQPITIQPQTKGGVTFTGVTKFRITGAHIKMDGFIFDQCDLSVNTFLFDQAQHCTLSNSTFQHSAGARTVVLISAGSNQNTVTGCRFIDIAGRSVQVKVNDAIKKLGVPTDNVISNNLFQDIPPLHDNGRETVKLGQDQPTWGHIVTRTIVEDNTFIRCDGEGEIISNKCSGNIFRRNKFHDCKGELVMRGGENCLIEANQFYNCNGGIRLSGKNHTVKNNLIVNSRGTGIRLLYGMTQNQGGHYQAATDCLIANNTIVNAQRAGILIGDGRNKDWKEKGFQNIPPQNNRFLNNIITGSTGDLLIADHAPNNIIEGNLLHKQDAATVSNPGANPLFADPLFRDPAAGDYRTSHQPTHPTKGATRHQTPSTPR